MADLRQMEQSIEAKMRAAGVGGPTISSFLHSVRKVKAGERGMLPETSVDPVPTLPRLDELADRNGNAGEGLLGQLAVIKLNGGLGTSMGLERAKSLIPIKGTDTFLDFIARQVIHLRGGKGRREPAFYLMNSFVTRRDTLDYLSRYSELNADGPLDFLQSMVPKLNATTLEPVTWPAAPELEWCPPGHGDLYPSLLGSGLCDRLLQAGTRYLFVSNSDNLGATVDPGLLRYFADSGLSFLMEVAERTGADRKGGHLARHQATGRFLLRESAQCPKEDEALFQDIERHRFFNTNNLWIRLDHLRTELERRLGVLPLPLITNLKTVDPKKADSPKVLQLESAMGAAIECFETAGAMVVPRTRFAPVKATVDLLALRSDAYAVTDDFRLALAALRNGQPPIVQLDPKQYRLLADFDRLIPSAPSLLACRSLEVTGPVQFAPGIVCEGSVQIVNPGTETRVLKPGTYRDQCVQF